ncbi:hypothetical protein V6N11_039370 [Hibiscus sabdariffa]|uniref:Uncharacterized protein n=1 Tax=Hibiscus sabdariffa TaxID=183260 RepID=A0ABR2SMP4_9ROSI
MVSEIGVMVDLAEISQLGDGPTETVTSGGGSGSVPVHSSAVFPFMTQVETPNPQSVMPTTTQQSIQHDTTPSSQHINSSNSPSFVDQHVGCDLDGPTTAFGAGGAVNQSVEHESDAATAATGATLVDSGSTNLQEAVQDTLDTAADSGPCDVAGVMYPAQIDEQQLSQTNVNIQSIPPPVVPITNTHRMSFLSVLASVMATLQQLQAIFGLSKVCA